MTSISPSFAAEQQKITPTEEQQNQVSAELTDAESKSTQEDASTIGEINEKEAEQVAPVQEQQNQVLDELTDAEPKSTQEVPVQEQQNQVPAELTDAETKSEVNVSTFKEFEDAIKNKDIRTINIVSSFNFERAITFPGRHLTIKGNADKGVVINALHHKLSSSSSGKDSLTIENTSINKTTGGSFFYTSTPQQPWDILVKDVQYNGESFIDNKSGTITFDGDNQINTSTYSAEADHIIFKSGSKYNGEVPLHTSGVGNAALFSSYGGTVTIENNANVNINTQRKSASYGVFFNFNTIDIGENAKLNVEGNVPAISFGGISSSPGSLNIASGADVNLKTLGDTALIRSVGAQSASINVNSNATLNVEGQDTPIDLMSNSTINVAPNATFNVTGKGEALFAMGANSKIILDNPKAFEFKNLQSNKSIFGTRIKPAKNMILKINNSDINVWDKNGEYETPPVSSWKDVSYLSTFINGAMSSNTSSSDANLTANFQMGDYGKISGGATEKEKVPSAPKVDEVKDIDTKVTGSAEAGSTVTVKVGDKELGTGQADENGNYSIDIPKQEAGTKLSVTASNKAGTSQVTEVTVKETLKVPDAP
ncbi:Ig-like domain-containing protein, partial [Bacillus mycoides]|uniref:Ig-like domain-containing protein n=1 Tax=Bacillus mycoides TaxID=1405 RepID=UPI003D64BCD8